MERYWWKISFRPTIVILFFEMASHTSIIVPEQVTRMSMALSFLDTSTLNVPKLKPESTFVENEEINASTTHSFSQERNTAKEDPPKVLIANGFDGTNL